MKPVFCFMFPFLRAVRVDRVEVVEIWANINGAIGSNCRLWSNSAIRFESPLLDRFRFITLPICRAVIWKDSQRYKYNFVFKTHIKITGLLLSKVLENSIRKKLKSNSHPLQSINNWRMNGRFEGVIQKVNKPKFINKHTVWSISLKENGKWTSVWRKDQSKADELYRLLVKRMKSNGNMFQRQILDQTHWILC